MRDSGKHENSWRDTGFDRYLGRMTEILARGVVLGKKTVFSLEITESLQKFRMRFCREKGARMRVQEPPFQALSTPLETRRLWGSKQLVAMSEIQANIWPINHWGILFKRFITYRAW